MHVYVFSLVKGEEGKKESVYIVSLLLDPTDSVGKKE